MENSGEMHESHLCISERREDLLKVIAVTTDPFQLESVETIKPQSSL